MLAFLPRLAWLIKSTSEHLSKGNPLFPRIAQRSYDYEHVRIYTTSIEGLYGTKSTVFATLRAHIFQLK